MRVGLYPLSVIAEFLGQRPEEMTTRIELDKLPAIEVPAATRPTRKVALMAFHEWLAGRSHNKPLTVHQLETELERCAEAVLRRHQAKTARKGKKTQLEAAA
jgi:hypothetical protein